MALFEPAAGLVIRYDFLWKREAVHGLDQGAKDRPCAIVLASEPRADKSRQVVVCPITHAPPEEEHSAIAIPRQVAAHLGLDAQRSWVRTHEVNLLTWEHGRLPYGVTPADSERWAFGFIPPRLHIQVRDQVLALRQRQLLAVVPRP